MDRLVDASIAVRWVIGYTSPLGLKPLILFSKAFLVRIATNKSYANLTNCRYICIGTQIIFTNWLNDAASYGKANPSIYSQLITHAAHYAKPNNLTSSSFIFNALLAMC